MYIYLRKYLWQRGCFVGWVAVATVIVINSVIGGFGGGVGCDKWMWHFNFYFKVSLPITTSIGIYLLLNLVFTPEHLWTDSMPTWWHMSDRIYRQRLQMPLSTWIQGHQLRGKKRWVKKTFSFGEILLWKTLPDPLSYLSMNPTVSLIQPAIRPSAPPDVWIPFCPSCFPIHLSD